LRLTDVRRDHRSQAEAERANPRGVDGLDGAQESERADIVVDHRVQSRIRRVPADFAEATEVEAQARDARGTEPPRQRSEEPADLVLLDREAVHAEQGGRPVEVPGQGSFRTGRRHGSIRTCAGSAAAHEKTAPDGTRAPPGA
jgi:hypothetical protein